MAAKTPSQLTPARLEAFSDGVIAVIITIMVLDLKVPQVNGSSGLQAVLPILLVYALSFLFVGIYWVNHHLLINRVESVDPRTLYSNLLFLFFLSLIPFFTSWMLEKDRSPFSVQIYTASLTASGAAFMLLRLSIERRLRLAHSHEQSDSSTQLKHWSSLALYVAALFLARVSPILALLLDAAVNLIWILPDLGTGQRHAERASDP